MGRKKAFLELSRGRQHIIILYLSNIVALLFIFLLLREPKHQGRLRQIKRHAEMNIGNKVNTTSKTARTSSKNVTSIFLSVHVVVKSLKLEIPPCRFADCVKKCYSTKLRGARAAQIFFLIQPMNSLLPGVFLCCCRRPWDVLSKTLYL